MSTFFEAYARAFKRYLPSPFSLAVLLTFFTVVLALFVGNLPDDRRMLFIADAWYQGLWKPNLLVFAFQMMLILVLGHALALSPFVENVINNILSNCKSNATLAFFIALSTCVVALFNWGLGLIFGAIFAQKAYVYAQQNHIPVNYPLLGAAGYTGLMVWHGGISGSSLVKVAEPGHLRNLMSNIFSENQLETLPESISYSATVFSSMNISNSILMLIAIPFVAWLLGKQNNFTEESFHFTNLKKDLQVSKGTGAEKLDNSRWFNLLIGLLFISYAISLILRTPKPWEFGFITPNFLNLCLLALGLIAHPNLKSYFKAVDEGIKGASGILLQFPLYFGILGIMTSTSLIDWFSSLLINISNEHTFPVFTVISAGVVNFFVPSGGGQWMVQGPIIINAASTLGVPLNKSILALAYGDQLTNMMQPFWALPLLSITRLQAKSLLPYSLVFMLVGFVIYIITLIIF